MSTRYSGSMVDGGRWDRFEFRPDDIVIATPSKSGTTWLQTIATLLVDGDPALPRSTNDRAPWLDVLFEDEASLFERLAAEPSRRILKTHAPLDGLPLPDDVRHLTIVRHPLDVAMSDADHSRNTSRRAAARAQRSAGLEVDEPATDHFDVGDDRTVLLDFIRGQNEPSPTGPRSLVEWAHYTRQSYERRSAPNVLVLHYQNLWDDLPGQMRVIADHLGAADAVHGSHWPAIVDAARLTRMRETAHRRAPEADRGFWHEPRAFFASGGRRAWPTLLDPTELEEFHARLGEALGHDDDLIRWALDGGPLAV